MTSVYFLSIHALAWGLLYIIGNNHAAAAGKVDLGRENVNRRITFKLTFANRDLIWFGDPSSPTALVYPKPDARPTASDVFITATLEEHRSRARRYVRDARIVTVEDSQIVYAFTKNGEKLVGTVDDQGHFRPNDFYKNNRELLLTWPSNVSSLAYDVRENALYYDVEVPGPIVTEALDFLPFELVDTEGKSVTGRFSIDFAPSAGASGPTNSSLVSLSLQQSGKPIIFATAKVPRVFRRTDVELCAFDNRTGSYLPEAVYRARQISNTDAQPGVTVLVAGEFTPAIATGTRSLCIVEALRPSDRPAMPRPKITIDGNFDDWRNVLGLDDPRGDLVPYLDYVSDVDLLEFKVSHDDEKIYLYARVAGQIGRSHPDGGRSYFYAYMDVDQNADTGFLPSRDDECYYGVDIGDDCEIQFEFVNNRFRKTFYGFCGLGGNDNVLKQQLTIGKSVYGRFDANGVERKNYKSEYIYRNGVAEITEDLKQGTSDTIHLAVSPDGSEVEIASKYTGFLKNPKGEPIVKPGQTIDIAAGMECDSKAYIGKSKWAADSTKAIRGYRLTPANGHIDSRQAKE